MCFNGNEDISMHSSVWESNSFINVPSKKLIVINVAGYDEDIRLVAFDEMAAGPGPFLSCLLCKSFYLRLY